MMLGTMQVTLLGSIRMLLLTVRIKLEPVRMVLLAIRMLLGARRMILLTVRMIYIIGVILLTIKIMLGTMRTIELLTCHQGSCLRPSASVYAGRPLYPQALRMS